MIILKKQMQFNQYSLRKRAIESFVISMKKRTIWNKIIKKYNISWDNEPLSGKNVWLLKKIKMFANILKIGIYLGSEV